MGSLLTSIQIFDRLTLALQMGSQAGVEVLRAPVEFLLLSVSALSAKKNAHKARPKATYDRNLLSRSLIDFSRQRLMTVSE